MPARYNKTYIEMHMATKELRRFSLDIRAQTAKKKVTKEIPTAQKYFERIFKCETSNNLAAKLNP